MEQERQPEVKLLVRFRLGRSRLLGDHVARITAIHGPFGVGDWLVALEFPCGTVLPTLAYHIDALWSDLEVVT